MKKRGTPSIYSGISEEVKRLYKSKVGLKKIGINVFENWYNCQKDRCTYCELTSAQSLLLFHQYPEATRGGRRGKRLELERKNPLIQCYGDDINNLALACYWCNNAKTNYFTFDEFKIIGQAFREIQKNRFNNITSKK